MGITINGSANTVAGVAAGGINDNVVDNGTMADDAIGIAELSATGTASSSTFLRGDNSWASAGAAAEILAWVNFNGTGTVAIRDHYNVSSITDVATGHYTVNFTNNLPTNYATIVTSDGLYNGSVTSLGHNDADTAHTNAGNVKVEARGADGSGSTADSETYCVVCIS